MRLLLAILAVLGALFGGAAASAHDVRPAYLELREAPAGTIRIAWRQPVQEGRALLLTPELSNGWLARPPEREHVADQWRMRQWTLAAPGERLEGLTVRVAGLEATMTSVLLRVERADGRSFETILRPDRTSARIEFAAIRHGLQVPAYFRFGVEHIFTGIDHLAFVLGLVLLVGINRRLVLAITAFTLAHSLTLAASALGFVHAPSATVEALIALSIVFVACELAKGEERHSLTRAAPWLIAFTFGLLHGFGFAGALAAIGLPEHAIPLALLLFNLGVEAGQLAFVAAILAAWLVVRGLRAQLPSLSDDLGRRLAGYGLGSIAAFWFVERTAAAFA